MTKLIRYYFLIINIVTFVIRGLDKWKAKTNKRRVSEKQLLILVALGGGIGGLMGQSFFRHKTIKGSFLRRYILILAVWIAVLLFLLIEYS